MMHCSIAYRNIIGWIVIPGYYIDMLRPIEVINRFMRPHEVSCHRYIRSMLSNKADFIKKTFKIAVRHEPVIIYRYTLKCGHAPFTKPAGYDFGQIGRCLYFFPVVISMSPEICIPASIQFLDASVTVFEPYSEGFSAILAITIRIDPVFITYVP